MKWATRERPKIDRLACPWLIRRFIDAEAEIRYVPAAQVLAVAESERSALAPGLLAISLGLGANIGDDQELLKAALPLYDALYTWCCSLARERHGWHPKTILKEMGR
jgi:hypothetical protein